MIFVPVVKEFSSFLSKLNAHIGFIFAHMHPTLYGHACRN